MTCLRCNRDDLDFFVVTIRGAKREASVGLCVDCTEDFRDWIALVPEGYAKQMKQLEGLATAVGR